jgi:hypothetical protein
MFRFPVEVVKVLSKKIANNQDPFSDHLTIRSCYCFAHKDMKLQ